jgi:PAS domain S-box-containing protein
VERLRSRLPDRSPATHEVRLPPRREWREVLEHRWAQYALALAAVCSATLLRLPFEGWLQGRAPYGLYFPVLVTIAWYCGAAVTMFAALLSWAAGYFLVPAEPGHETSIAVYAVNAGALILLALFARGSRAELGAAQTRRRESESRLAGIVDSAMDAIVTVDERQDILLFNAAAEQMFGREGAELIGRPLDMLIPERFRAAHREHVERFARSGHTSRRLGQLGHIWGLRANGDEFPIEASISQTRPADGALLTVILRDVSESRELQRRLRQTEEHAALATLVTGIAHDIGTPMNVILGYADMLARSLRDEKDRERISIIKEQVERVTRLIQTLMNFARPHVEAPRHLRIEDVADRTLGLIEETARKKGIAVERAFGETAPLLAQGERLERALLDLLVNACDAMPQGGALRVATRAFGDAVEIRIEDTGIGIAPDALGKIFEPFYTTKPRGKGTGLGLSVARSIVAEHNGTIEVESKLGKGTVFQIRFPADQAPAGADRAASA